ncbi:hypothetical protein BLS_001353 [Venturia inaequalis]|uniref:Phosphatidylglycerol/phosphatidylinositol transfer protein n=1 Tax=Venturia inaequalis TaxID=5025 RepID=A0A8H3VB98_VENIN|nr:hypothetical protein BLS_001353 [Venturia inaequalis]
MKFSSALLFTAIASAIALPSEVEERESKKIHPLSYKSCGDLNDVLQVESLTLDPNPLEHGKNSIIANGTLTEDITEGTMISVRVKAGALTVYHKELDLCDLAKSKSDITCPIKAGPINIEKEFEIPKNIPHTNLKIALSGTTADGGQLTCYNIAVGI